MPSRVNRIGARWDHVGTLGQGWADDWQHDRLSMWGQGMGREVVPNNELTAARKALPSPSGSRRPMSRQELADLCNAALATKYAAQDRRQRWAGFTEKTIGALERGETRWPNDDYRWALCTVLKAEERTLGLYIDRPTQQTLTDRSSPVTGTHLDNDVRRREMLPLAAMAVTASQLPWVVNEGQAPAVFDTAAEWRTWLRRGVLESGQYFTALPIQELEAALRHGNLAYQSARYSDLRKLPALIGSVEALFSQQHNAADTPRAARAASGVYLLASKLAAKLGDGDLAWTTADRARCFGLIAADPTLIAIAAYQTSCALAKQPGGAGAAEEVAVSAADAIASHRLHRAAAYMSAYGALLLHAAFAAARQADERGASMHLRAAELAADQLGRNSNELWTAFGPANVKLHRISVAVALNDNRLALRAAERLDASQIPITLTSRRAQVHLDLAAAYSATGKSDPEAMLQLLEYERLVPEAVRLNSAAANLITKLLHRERPSHTPGLRALAHRAGVHDV